MSSRAKLLTTAAICSGEIPGTNRPALAGPDRRQRTQAHHHLPVTGNDQNRFVRLCQGESEAYHCRTAHRAPQVEIPVIITDCCNIVGKRSQAGNN